MKLHDDLPAAVRDCEFKLYPWTYLRFSFYAGLDLPDDDAYSLGTGNGLRKYIEDPDIENLDLDELRDALSEQMDAPIPGQYPRVRLVRDQPGYFINPHTDTPKQAVTLLVVLSGGRGTLLHHDQHSQPVRELSGSYAFVPRADTWHSVAPSEVVRNRLLIHYYHEEWR